MIDPDVSDKKTYVRKLETQYLDAKMRTASPTKDMRPTSH